MASLNNDKDSNEQFNLQPENQEKILNKAHEIVSNKKSKVNFETTFECFYEETNNTNKFALGFCLLSILKEIELDHIDPNIKTKIKKTIIEEMI